MYAYEMHCHTFQGSLCGIATGAAMARAYKKQGYTGLCITDHFFNGNCAVPRDLPWEERIDRFYWGYEDAKAEGDRIGLQVFFGVEFKPLGHAAEFLTYGLPREWWKAHPEMMGWDHEAYARAVHEAGGFIVHAHPFRKAPYLPPTTYLYPDCVDAVEVINTKQRFHEAVYNRQALEYAKKLDLPMTCGSDNHDGLPDATVGGIESPRILRDVEDLIALLRSREHQIRATELFRDDGDVHGIR